MGPKPQNPKNKRPARRLFARPIANIASESDSAQSWSGACGTARRNKQMSLLEPQPELAFCNPADFGDVTSPAEYAQRVKMTGAQAIDRILKAVGKEHVPHNLDRQSLCREIADAYFSRDCAFDLFEGSKSHQRLEELRRMREATETLIALLKPDVGMDAMIASALVRAGIIAPSTPMSRPLTVVSFLEQLRRAIAETEKIQQGINRKWRAGHKHDPSLRGRRVTAKEWLAGVMLPLVFEMHFPRHAGRSRGKGGAPSGPMVRFISANEGTRFAV
jgi:hypothetical protein